MGVQYGAQYICVADFSTQQGKYYISARIIDVETVQVINSYSKFISVKHSDYVIELMDGIEKFALDFISETANERAAKETTLKEQEAEEKEGLKKAIEQGYIQIDGIMFLLTKQNMTYSRAKKIAKECTIGGFNDWRLPSTTEMSRIIEVSKLYHRQNSDFPDYSNTAWGCDKNRYLSSKNTILTDWNFDGPIGVIFVRDAKTGE